MTDAASSLGLPQRDLAALPFAGTPVAPLSEVVPRRRYDRERRARLDAERLLEAKSRELFEANQRLKAEADRLEAAVIERTADLDRARAEAEAANAAKSVFLATMSHEIRTPLNGVLGMAAALAETGLSASQAEMLEVVTASGELLLAIINDILDLSKIEAGRMELEQVPFRLDDPLNAALRLYQLQAEEKGLRLEAAIAPSARVPVEGDPTRLRQIVGNLLSNAIKFTEHGSVRLAARIGPAPDADGPGTGEQGLGAPDVGAPGRGQLVLSVEDTGIGIPPDRMSRLFRPFMQTDASIARRFGGTGLGLAITQSLCGLLGGGIAVASTPGEGTTFTVRVPVTLLPERRSNLDRAADPCPTTLARAWLAEVRPRLLVVDDNPTNRLVMKHLLARFQAEVTLACDGAEAVQAHARYRFDAILMDMVMPVLDGPGAARAIRAAEAGWGQPRTPIIALTANARSEEIAICLDAGMDDHLAKPVRPEHLARRIARALGGPPKDWRVPIIDAT
jgi:signal transduction histidine kinase/CheY-like chemotaxis protein